MNDYLFQLGQNHDLSLAEIKAVYPQAEYNLRGQFGKLSFKKSEDNCLEQACRLGGTTKIAKQVSTYQEENVYPRLLELVKEAGNKNFSITTTGNMPSLEEKIKADLKEMGISARFVASGKSSLSPLIVDKQHVTELIVDEDEKAIYHTVWLHPYKKWIERDRKKPYIDPKSGMLPPKLARMMVNLALGSKSSTGLTLVDPFCGTGTILLEGKLMGLNVVGSDLSPAVVSGAARNLDWLPVDQACGEVGNHQVFQSDATHLSESLGQKVDLIVTEPYLGPANFDHNKIPNIVKGLEKLYLGALKDWTKILPSGGIVVMVFPQFLRANRTISTWDLIDSKVRLSYNLRVDDLVFTRPNARIIRQIVILEKK